VTGHFDYITCVTASILRENQHRTEQYRTGQHRKRQHAHPAHVKEEDGAAITVYWRGADRGNQGPSQVLSGRVISNMHFVNKKPLNIGIMPSRSPQMKICPTNKDRV
jgi:hypothetical protein